MMKNMVTMMVMVGSLVAQSSACDAGSAPSVPDGGDCKFCPTGTYALSGDLYCTHCPPGFWSPINSVSKDACYPLSAFKTAEVCAAGSYPANDECTFCPVGSYSLAGAQSCTKCPTGYSSPINSVSPDACYPAAAKKVAEICAAGSVLKNGVCTFCPPGQYALSGDAACTHCPPGFWSPIDSISKDACYPLSAMKTKALLCPPGSAPEGGVCTFCPVGSYALAGSQSCTQCPAGFSSPPNSVSPDACAPHAHKKVHEICAAGSIPVGGVCQACPEGTYALAAAQSCTPCSAGFSAPIASVSPDACYPLSPSAKKVKDIATCAAGSVSVNGVCTFCPVGTYALAAAQSCTHCPSGYSAPINSVSPDACYPLASKKVKDLVTCAAGSTPVNGLCTFCPVGSYALAAAQSCTVCPPGFSAPIASVSPDACYPVGAKKVKATCDAGSAPVDGVCTFCPTGTYALAGASSCTHCPAGYSSPPNSVSPDACFVKSSKKVKSSSCSAGSAPVVQIDGHRDCEFCPVGSYALAGADSCTKCPVGYSSPINSVSPDACFSTNLRA